MLVRCCLKFLFESRNATRQREKGNKEKEKEVYAGFSYVERKKIVCKKLTHNKKICGAVEFYIYCTHILNSA